MTSKLLLLGTRSHGHTQAQPTVVEVDSATGRVVSHHPLTDAHHEPHSTLYRRAILDLDTLTIHPL